MRRRDFIRGIAGSTAAWPLAARAQQSGQMRRIGVLMNTTAEDGQNRLKAFQQALQQLGWQEGHNVRFDIRWGANNVSLDRKYAAELVALAPDVILASGTLSVTAVQRESHTIAIVFNDVSDPVGEELNLRMAGARQMGQ